MPNHTNKEMSRLDVAERLSKILSLVAIPVVVAVLGLYIQDTLSKRGTRQAYVTLAISLLSETEKDIPPELSDWAWNLLSDNSPTPIRPEVLASLKKRGARIPNPNISFRQEPNVVSPDGRFIVYGRGRSLVIYDHVSRRSMGDQTYGDSKVRFVGFSPDSKLQALISEEGYFNIYHLTPAHEVFLKGKIKPTAPILGASFDDESNILNILCSDGKLFSVDISDKKQTQGYASEDDISESQIDIDDFTSTFLAYYREF